MILGHESLALFGIGLLNVFLALSLSVVRTRPKQQRTLPLDSPGFETATR